jgi:acyl-CoA synthetase (NDP forming)
MADPAIAMTILIVDFPRADRCSPEDWDCVIKAAIGAQKETGARYAVAATLPELMPEGVAEQFISAGIIPFCGLTEAIAACAAAAIRPPSNAEPIVLPGPDLDSVFIAEAEAKRRLGGCGLRIPSLERCSSVAEVLTAAARVGFPIVLKGEGIAHKTEAGAVRLNIKSPQAAEEAATGMDAQSYLVEEMIGDGIVELLIGVVKDPAHGFVLTIGAGGTLTEILKDTVSVLVPASTAEIEAALGTLKVAPLLNGYRGASPCDKPAILRAIQAVQDYTMANTVGLQEIEINPLICTATDAVAADALLRCAN